MWPMGLGPLGLFLGYLLSIQKVINIYRSITGENEIETVKNGIYLK